MRARLSVAAALLFAGTAGAQSKTYVIRNATIYPVSSAKLERGSIVIRDGKIAAVGATVDAPAGATVIDGTGLSVYPGMMDSGTQLGLVEIGSVPGSTDTQEIGEFNPQDVALTAVNPHSELIPVTRSNGITTVITSAGGGSISGFASLIDLNGWTTNEMGVRRQAALIVNFPTIRGGGLGFQRGGGANMAEEIARRTQSLRTFLAEAKAYAEARAKAGSEWTSKSNQPMEAMIPVVRGEVPVIFDVQSAEQIRGALALSDSFGLKPILRGAKDAWRLADTLAARKVPVIVGPTTSTPDGDDPYDLVYANPGVLAKAGVKIAFQTSDAADARNLPYQAALAVAYGLDETEALKAVTLNPAQIWGVGDQYGSLDAGKVANVIVTTGDPLDVRSVARYVFVRGELVSLDDRHKKLYEQFRARPKAAR